MASSAANAQRVDSVTVRLRVADTANRPVAGADVSVIHGLNDVRAAGVADANGTRVLRLARTNDAIEIVARRIGYARASVFVTPASDTLSLDITLKPAPQTLATVKVTAQEDVKRRSYHVDADEIENSSRLIMNGMDVLTKLKPDILSGRMPGCGVQSVWVNGKRIFNVLLDEMAVARLPRSPSRVRASGRRAVTAGSGGSVIDTIATIMTSIKPEHIAEMNYLDCFDNSMPGLHASSALYVVLKEGIGFEPGVGSYVADTKPNSATGAAMPAMLAPYRKRLLGVFDLATGNPLQNVQVLDVARGTFAFTTATGSVSLVFLPEGTSMLRLHRDGYVDTTFTVTIEPSDTMPLTLVLTARR